MVAIIATIGYYINLPFGLSASCVAFLFLYFGRLYRKYESKIKLNGWICMGIFVALIPLSFVNNVQMGANRYSNNIFVVIIGAVGGIYCVIYVSKLLQYRKYTGLIRIFGKTSFYIMSFHMLVFLMCNYLQVKIMGLPSDMKAVFPTIYNTNAIWVIIYLIMGLGIPTVFYAIYRYIIGNIKQIYIGL